MQRIISLCLAAGLSALALVAQSAEPLPKIITSESYWYNKSLGRVIEEHVEGDYLRGAIQAKHNPSPFRITIKDSEDVNGRTLGTRSAAVELIAWLNGASADFAQNLLQKLTGQNFRVQQEWSGWFSDNQLYLTWSVEQNRLIIDQEAKAAGVPTAQFRRMHPWPARP